MSGMGTRSKQTKPNILNLNVQSPSLLERVASDVDESDFGELKKFFAQKLNAFENRIMERIGELVAEVSCLKKAICSIKARVTSVENNVVDVSHSVNELQNRVNSLENNSISTDFIVHNVPADAKVEQVIEEACNKLGCGSLIPVKAFRVKAKNKNSSAPVIVKLSTADQRKTFFKSLAQYRKKNKSGLTLNDVGLAGDGFLTIFECLTQTNRNIMSAALQHKVKNKLVAVFSIRGDVFVRCNADEEAIKITSLNELETIVGATTISKS